MVGLIIFILTFSLQIHAKELVINCDYNSLLHFKDKNKKEFSGYAIELAQKVFLSLGLKYKFQMKNTAHNLQALKDGEIDAILSFERTNSVEDEFQWVGPYFANEWVLVGKRSKDLRINYLKEATGLKIGARRFGSFGKLLNSNGLSTKEMPTSKQLALALKRDEIDLWATESMTFNHYSRLIRFTNYKIAYTSKEKVYIYMAFNKGVDPKIIAKLNIAFRELRINGTFKDLQEKYFPNH
ncbi:MAG: substrate-binding periplasmic protein [Bacteriovoracaceae bacterium]